MKWVGIRLKTVKLDRQRELADQPIRPCCSSILNGSLIRFVVETTLLFVAVIYRGNLTHSKSNKVNLTQGKKVKFVKGDSCPECAEALQWEDGDEVFCDNCGSEFEVDWSRLLEASND